MAQISKGLRSVLSSSLVYDTFQTVVGGVAARRRVCAQYVRAKPSDVIVDVGCGTADLLRFLPPTATYFGFDLSEKYIKKATARYAGRGHCRFRCADLNDVSPDEMPYCDVAMIFGVLHHIDDGEAARVLAGVHERLAPGGRVICIDPAFRDGQSPMARFLIRHDRGQNVRSADGYAALVPAGYSKKEVVLRDDLLFVPYTLAILCLEK